MFTVSDNEVLSKAETWGEKGKSQNEVFPQDEGYLEVRDTSIGRNKRDDRGNYKIIIVIIIVFNATILETLFHLFLYKYNKV